MLAKAKGLLRRGLRAFGGHTEPVPLSNKENLPSGNKESSPPGNKERTPHSTSKVSQPPSSSNPIKRWLENVSTPVYGSPINKVRPRVDNIDFHINFSDSVELGSPPAWFNETWDNDPEIRRFLCGDEVPNDQVHSAFRATHYTPRYQPDTTINPRPSPSPVTPVLPQPAVTAPSLNHPEKLARSPSLNTMSNTVVHSNEKGQVVTSAQKPAISPSLNTIPDTVVQFNEVLTSVPKSTSSPSLNTIPDTVVHFNEKGQVVASAQKRAYFPDDTGPQHPAKRAKLEPESSATKRKRSGDTNDDDEWDSDPPTSPEYKISSASDDDDSDTSDAPSSPCVKRVKRDAKQASVKNGRSLKSKGKRTRKKKKKAWDSDRSMSEPSDLDYESDEEYFIPTGERDELLNNKLTRERAKRLLDAVKLPQGHHLSPDVQQTAHQLLTRGCLPTIHRHWEKDFSTLPESLFFSGKDDKTQRKESNFVLENDKGSEFYAIRAFQELLKICGNVRDYCNILDICPGIYIKKSIEKYLRWALADAGVRVQPDTPPVHVIYCKHQDEDPKEAFEKVAKALESLLDTWQGQLAAPHDGEEGWPALIGFVLCAPVLSVICLDTNPHLQTLTQGIKFLGHFDLSDFDQDVWNTLAIAILVMHIKRTVAKLARIYGDRFVASLIDNPAMGSPDPDG
ncbi:hypothetical protein N7505_005209 [Penicillium chrysogenum]|uniref:Uncharacterized protein n=1 Tax=Penicillium chrysogenum TaxID=5076 RepID=A0ABQ8WHK8_PENCH|nr:hypothetical protein N7505_005209 [Penicillium chrysogenum]